jgi:FkbM family methyltransferase
MKTILKFVLKVVPSRAIEKIRRFLDPVRRGSLLFKPHIIKKDMEGEQFDFFIGDREGRDWYEYECINNPRWLEMRFMKDKIISKGDVIFECGSHHGCSTILLSRWVGESGKVIAFEPVPANFSILESNIALNKIENVISHMKGVGSSSGTLYFDKTTSAISSASLGIKIDIVPLDEFEHLKPTLIKIDVEGFEVDVLRGAKKILESRPKIELEIHPEQMAQFGVSTKDIFEIIDLKNYKTWIQWRDDEYPQEYVPGTEIRTRAHLFCLPI